MITRGALGEAAVGEHLDHVGGRGRRHAEVVEQAASPAPSSSRPRLDDAAELRPGAADAGRR